MIQGTTKLLGVIGDPIEHSLSPVMHNAAIAEMGVDYVYLPFPIHSTDLDAALAGFAAIGVQGFNVTIPHKQAILSRLSKVSKIAEAVGAVNTVWRTSEGWEGTNTDVVGFLAPLQNINTFWSEKTAVILGNGGASRAVVAGCAELGMTEIYVIGRNRQKLEVFQQSWLESPFSLSLQIQTWENLTDIIHQADLLVNTTPVGMYPHVENSPVTAAVMDRLKSDAIAYDLIYTPNPTQFLSLAKAKGAIIIDGLEMLVQQGASALQLWLKQSVPVEVMRYSLQKKLGLL
ncbi:shikimate 5-dehydrogenase [Lyngbya aestuarii BL J]|uniref:Shikimate dehydrogenase (NADP(+)) n=1 Tax=Lyngbya aestuarii BL J TaxID=1348334 RepID=U7QGG3_9CYAN|nr:shikimate dehydrogenase [Lyngbya aestuarii]ERT05511.1 shikimate 5-dehydrogenase [Lyngbya aestuarii BL J]